MGKIVATKRYLTPYAFGWKTIDGVYHAPNLNVKTIDFRNAEFQNNDATGVCGGCENLMFVCNLNKNVTTLELAFNDCKKLTETIDLTGFNNLTNLSNCFSGEEYLQTAKDLSSLTSVTNMSYTFANTVNLLASPALPPNTLNMHGTFQHWSIYSNNVMTDMPTIPTQVTDMEKCFKHCRALVNTTTIPNSVTNLGGCFCYCAALVTAPRIPANVTKISSTEQDRQGTTEVAEYGLFRECMNLAGDIYIDTRLLTDARWTFADCGTSSPNKTVHIYKYTDDTKTTLSDTYTAFINSSYLNTDGSRGTEAIANNVYFEFNDEASYNLAIDNDKYTVKNTDTGTEITTDTPASTNVTISAIKDAAMDSTGKITLPNKSS